MKPELERLLQDLLDSGQADAKLLSQLSSLGADEQEMDEVIEHLRAHGAEEIGSGPPLQIRDHYRAGPDKYELRWPLTPTIPLPVPFAELDRETQFFVLFGEWTRRECEGAMALNTGRVSEAAEIFQECLERARQIAVPELIARSHEGLMRVAQKHGTAEAARQHLTAAMQARAEAD